MKAEERIAKVNEIINKYMYLPRGKKEPVCATDALDEIDELYSGGVSEEELMKEAKAFLLSNTPDIRKGVKTMHWAAYRMAKFVLHLQSHPTPEISEGTIIVEAGARYRLGDEQEAWIKGAKWVISKGAKPISEENIPWSEIHSFIEVFHKTYGNKPWTTYSFVKALKNWLKTKEELNNE